MPHYGNAGAATGGEDLFSDAAPAGEPAATAEQDEGGETSLLPKSFFAGKELTPGTECKVRVERVLDDQVEVSYVPHEEAPEEAAPIPEGAPAGDTELAGLMG